MNELAKEESEVEIVELFKKIQDEFGEIIEEKRKVEQLRIIEQKKRFYDKYI